MTARAKSQWISDAAYYGRADAEPMYGGPDCHRTPRLANARGTSKPVIRLPLGALRKPNGMISTSRFSGAAWKYLTSAFLFTMPGFETEELAPWSDNGNERRRLSYVATHCPGLVSHIDRDNFIAGRDYVAQISGGLAAAHSLSDDEDFAGIRWRPNGGSIASLNGNADFDRVAVAIEFTNVGLS